MLNIVVKILVIVSLSPFVIAKSKKTQSKSYAILDASLGPAVVDQCSRPSPIGAKEFWNPTENEITKLEKSLLAFLKEIKPSMVFEFENATTFRQYVGYMQGDKKMIYINAFSNVIALVGKREDWYKKPIVACDGGTRFWGASYDVEAEKVFDLKFNGLL